MSLGKAGRVSALAAATYALAALAGACASPSPAIGAAWLVGSGFVAFRLALTLWRCVQQPGLDPKLRTRDERAMTQGWGMRLTLARGLALVLLGGLSASGASALSWIFYLYVFHAVGDWFDGFIARLEDRTSEAGARLDGELDVLGILVVSVALVHHERLHFTYLLVGFGQPVLMWAIAHRRRRQLALYPERMQQNSHTRIYAGFQMAIIATAAQERVAVWAVTWTAAIWMWPTILAFVADWRAVCGHRPATPGHRAPLYAFEWPVPLAARVALACAMPLVLLYPPRGLAPGLLLPLLLLIVAGVLPRLGACALLLMIGLGASSGLLEMVLLSAASVVAILGPGWPRGTQSRPSGLWAPEESLLLRRWGDSWG